MNVSFDRKRALQHSNVPGAVLDAAIKIGELKATRASGRRLIILAADLETWLCMCRDRGYFPAAPKPDREANERLAERNRKRKAEVARRKAERDRAPA